MGIVQVNSEGVKTLQDTSKALESARAELERETQTVKSQMEGYSNSLGEHHRSLMSAIEAIENVIKQSTAPVQELSEKLNELAGKYQEWIDDDPYGGIN